MTTLNDHERRITKLEGRVGDIEACHSKSIYELKRDSIENRLGMDMLLDHFGLPRVTREQIDAILDSE